MFTILQLWKLLQALKTFMQKKTAVMQGVQGVQGATGFPRVEVQHYHNFKHQKAQGSYPPTAIALGQCPLKQHCLRAKDERPPQHVALWWFSSVMIFSIIAQPSSTVFKATSPGITPQGVHTPYTHPSGGVHTLHPPLRGCTNPTPPHRALHHCSASPRA